MMSPNADAGPLINKRSIRLDVNTVNTPTSTFTPPRPPPPRYPSHHGLPTPHRRPLLLLRTHPPLPHARAASPPPLIIHVRNAGDTGDPDHPLSPGWSFIFPPLPGEVVINKRKNNAFAGTELGRVVRSDAEIVVVGFQTDYSIRATCSAALGRGNEVLLIRGAHATCDRIQVLNGGGITPASRIETEIESELEEAGVHLS